MKRKLSGLLGGLALSAGLLAFADSTDAGDAKGPWQPILSKEIYQELSKRETDLVRDLLDGKLDEKAVHRAKFGSVLIAALTMSVKDGVAPNELLTTRNVSLKVAASLAKKEQWPEAKKLSTLLPNKAKPDAAVK